MSSPNIAMGEYYNLRWNNFFQNLIQVFSELKYKELLVDTTLECEGHQIKVHKIVLAACSDFFMNLFKNLEDIHPVIMFYDIKFIHLKQIIQFIYQGEVKVQDIDLEGVLSLGEKLQVKGLSSVTLKSDGSSTGDPISESSLKYKILVKSSAINCPKSENDVKSDNEPIKKKIKLVALNEKLPQKSTDKTAEVNQQNITKKDNSTNKSKVQTYKHLIKNSELKNNSVETNRKRIILDKHISVKNNLIEKQISEIKQNNSDQNISNESDSSEKPVNAFILFSKEWRKKLKVEYPDEDFKSISVRLGNLWKSLTSETRESYYIAARQAQLCFQQSKSDL